MQSVTYPETHIVELPLSDMGFRMEVVNQRKDGAGRQHGAHSYRVHELDFFVTAAVLAVDVARDLQGVLHE